MLEEFGKVIAPGGSGIVVSSMAGHMGMAPLTAEQEHALAYTPADELAQLPFLGPDAVTSSGYAYALSKRANHLRVQGAAVTWGTAVRASTRSAPASSSPRSPRTRCPDPAPPATRP